MLDSHDDFLLNFGIIIWKFYLIQHKLLLLMLFSFRQEIRISRMSFVQLFFNCFLFILFKQLFSAPNMRQPCLKCIKVILLFLFLFFILKRLRVFWEWFITIIRKDQVSIWYFICVMFWFIMRIYIWLLCYFNLFS